MAMTEEQKKAAAEKRRAALEAKKAQEAAEAQKNAENEKKMAELTAQNEAMQKQIAELLSRMESMQKPQVISVTPSVEQVTFLWEAPVADDNIVTFGENGMFGRIVGKTGMFSIPKSEMSRVLDTMTRQFIEKRWLIVVDGLTADERKAMNIDYTEGEYLDKNVFANITQVGDQIISIYPNLCEGHKDMVAKAYYEAFLAGSPNITRENVKSLNKLSEKGSNAKGAFREILERMNAEDVDE